MLLSRVSSAVLLTLVTATPALAAPVIVDNIQGYGFDEKRTLVPFQSLVFDDVTGKVLARGDTKLAKNYPTAKVIDGQGKTMLPGLIDGHGHVASADEVRCYRARLPLHVPRLGIGDNQLPARGLRDGLLEDYLLKGGHAQQLLSAPVRVGTALEQ